MSAAPDVSAILLDAFREAVAGHARGRNMDYRAVLASGAGERIQHELRALAAFDLRELADTAARTAFWINLYNALVVDAVLKYRVRSRLNEIADVFDRVGCVVGEQWYSANDIEHGILRGNRRHPLRLRAPFGSRDPRRAQVMLRPDPRIHFALNCAARSCPPIRHYTAQALEAQLALAARAYLNGGQVAVDVQAMRVTLPRLLYYYAPDFGGGRFTQHGRRRLLDAVVPLLGEAELADWLRQHRTQLTITFDAYDWSLNIHDDNATD